jgi:hypothetical protein
MSAAQILKNNIENEFPVSSHFVKAPTKYDRRPQTTTDDHREAL